MEVFRITKAKYAKELSGIGAAKNGARWNSKGVEMIYTASNRSLAMADVAVGLNVGATKIKFCMMTIYIPSHAPVQTLNRNSLPENWNAIPAVETTKLIGDRFISEGKYLTIRVPSVVTQGDWNILINPLHPDFEMIKIIEVQDFPFDRRLF